MLLEICAHVENLKPSDILKISALSLDETHPLVDEPQFGIVKYILFHVLEKLSSSNSDDLIVNFDPSKLFLISHYLIPLLSNDAHYPPIDLPPLPTSTVLHDLLALDADSPVQCDDVTLNIDSSLFAFDPEVVKETKHEVVIAVSKLSLSPLLDSVDWSFFSI